MKGIHLLQRVAAFTLCCFMGMNTDLSAQTQCAYDNVQFGTSAAPTTPGVVVTMTTCIFGGEFRRVTGMIAGEDYEITTCGDFSFDTQLSIYPAGGGAGLGGNDDACGLQSIVSFTPSVTGSYDILVDQFFCASNTLCMTLRIERTSGGGAGPANDDCADAEPIDCGDTKSGETVTAGGESLGFCGTSDGTAGGVWYSWTGDGSCVELTTCNPGSNYDTKLRVWEGSCGALSCVTGNDDASCAFSFLRSTVNFVSSPGVEYFILVHGFAGAAGNFELSMTCAGAGVNNVCDGAIFLGVPTAAGTSVAFDLSCATADGPSPGAGTGGGGSCNSADGWCSFETNVQNDVWFFFVAPATGSVIIESVSPDDTQLALWAGLGDCEFFNANEVAANDDGGTGLDAQIGDQCTNLGLQPGVPYWIQLDGFAGDPAIGTLVITANVGGPPANDDCANATTIDISGGSGSAPWDNTCATADGPSPGPGSNSCNSNDGWCSFETAVASDVWYKIIAPASGSIDISIDNTEDMQLALWSGSCGSLVEVAANDDSGPVFAPLLDPVDCLIPGDCYYIQLDGFGANRGFGNLIVNDKGYGEFLVSISISNYDPIYDLTELTANSSGGVPGVTYSWNTGETTSSITFLSPCEDTQYSVDITDSRGCTITNFFQFDVLNNQPQNDSLCNAAPLAFINGMATAPFNNNCATPGLLSPGLGHGPNSCISQTGWCIGDTNVQNDVWFSFVAPLSGAISISTNSNDNLQLAIWTGTNCNDPSTFIKIGANDDTDTSFVPSLDSIDCLIPGETYYIQLDGFDSTVSYGDLIVEDKGYLIGEDSACNATLIRCGDTVMVSTICATHDSIGGCGVSEGTGNGVWFRFEGNGEAILVSTCHQGTNFDTQLMIFTGTCDSLGCIAGSNGNYCPANNRGESTIFHTIPGVDYFILIQGNDSSSGICQISINCYPCETDPEEGARDEEDGIEVSVTNHQFGPNQNELIIDYGNRLPITQDITATRQDWNWFVWEEFQDGTEPFPRLLNHNPCPLYEYHQPPWFSPIYDGQSPWIRRTRCIVFDPEGLDSFLVVSDPGMRITIWEVEGIPDPNSGIAYSCGEDGDAISRIACSHEPCDRNDPVRMGECCDQTCNYDSLPGRIYMIQAHSYDGFVHSNRIRIIRCPSISLQFSHLFKSVKNCGFNISCPGASDGKIDLGITGGVPPYSIIWTGTNNYSFTGEDPVELPAGTYNVTVIDQNDCLIDTTVTLTEPDPILVNLTPTLFNGFNISCFGGMDGKVKVKPLGGCPPYTYDWSNGDTTSTISELSDGLYEVMLKDANSCAGNNSISLTEPPPLTTDAGTNQMVLFGYTDQNCALLEASGTIGGIAGYTYSWEQNSIGGPLVSESPSVEVCPEDSTVYLLTVKDTNGCTFTDSVLICVFDIRCKHKNANKISICHFPPGSPTNMHTICIGKPAVAPHFALHQGDSLTPSDHIGPCGLIKICDWPTQDKQENSPPDFTNFSVFPNPFYRSTSFQFTLPKAQNLRLEVFNLQGKKVHTLFNGIVEKGREYRIEMSGEGLAAGIYCYRITTSNFNQVGKLVLIK